MAPSFRFTRQLQLATTVFWVATLILTATPASGQIVRIRPGLGIHVNAPYANIHIAPRQGINAPRKGNNRGEIDRSTRLPRRRIWGRRLELRQFRDPNAALPSRGKLEPRAENSRPPGEGLDADSPKLNQSPGLAVTPQTELPNQVHRFTSETDQIPTDQFSTATELAQLDDTQLFSALRNISSRLDKSLAKFQTGPGWQRYLQLPENLPSRLDNQEDLQVNMDALLETRSRFEQVAINPDFHIIANQPNFVATLSALREVNVRWDSQKTVTPSTDKQQETLPTPEPTHKHQALPGEHSILKR
jgi:hypothetical protein